ncbi:prephenate dehydratase [Paenibacillus swuensis]|uniref:Prephenate dehydratase n=1 Tax=Paenibacillus swuensis TaxID=1178515 RepID=A0A172TJV0_9BACL|nr:prephenate dehydratase [Paenibacillus swuensis]ANE47184.1 prephenate dehydratase [Paenibacillus swuensis]
MKRFALLGPGTFSEEAARYLLDNGKESVELVHHRLISDVFLSTVNGETDYSIIPVENTIEGSVSLHLDWLVHEVNLPIQAEWVFPITMNLIGFKEELPLLPGDSLDEKLRGMTTVASHPTALAQCRQFLRAQMPQADLHETGTTAEGAHFVKDNGPGKGYAAVGTKSAARLHGLDILFEQIQDHNNNFTRFVLVGAEPVHLDKPNEQKTSILVTLPEDFPGALHQVLSAFAWRRINLIKIESRPTKKMLGSYYFYIDIEAPMDSVLLPAALAEIEALGCQVRVMGSYPSYTYIGS